MEDSGKVKISSDLLLVRILLIGAFIFSLYLLGDYRKMKTETFVIYLSMAGLSLLFLIYFFTRPILYCDNENLYIQPLNKPQAKIPLKNIYAINFSIIGLNLTGFSYKIKYRNENEEVKTVRLFPGVSGGEQTFKDYTRAKNPDVETRWWSVGINELFD